MVLGFSELWISEMWQFRVLSKSSITLYVIYYLLFVDFVWLNLCSDWSWHSPVLCLAPTKTLFLTLPPDGTNKNMQALLVTPEAKEQLDKLFLLFYFLHLLNCGNLITYKRLCEPFFFKNFKRDKSNEGEPE